MTVSHESQGSHGGRRPIRLIIFDVDETLTRSERLDTDCYSRAVSEYLGCPIDTDWSRYRHQTDSGILSEVLQEHGHEGSPVTTERIKRRFLELLRAAHREDPSCCTEIAGARAMLERLGRCGGVRVAIATGGWADSARLKLRLAGIESRNFPFASADDAPERESILALAIDRAAKALDGAPRLVTYVGDAPWDVVAARRARVSFLGVARGPAERGALERAGVTALLSDFDDPSAFSKLMHGGRLGDPAQVG